MSAVRTKRRLEVWGVPGEREGSRKTKVQEVGREDQTMQGSKKQGERGRTRALPCTAVWGEFGGEVGL